MEKSRYVDSVHTCVNRDVYPREWPEWNDMEVNEANDNDSDGDNYSDTDQKVRIF